MQNNLIQSIALSFPALLWIVSGGVLLTIGDIAMRYFVERPESTRLFLFGFLFYCVGLLCLSFSYFNEEIAQASVALVLVNVITLLLLSAYVFNEPISFFGHVGIFLGIMAFIILELFA